MRTAQAEPGGNRVHTFEGVHNFRDYGGYPVVGGGRLRGGWLLRSAEPWEATPRDLADLAAMELKAVIDLRGPGERAAHPTPAGVCARIVQVDQKTSGLAPHLDAARDVRTPGDAMAAMRAGYADMVFRPSLVAIFTRYFEALAESDGPTLVHCLAGKDRTGIAVALLHTLVGVHRDDLMTDYLLTNTAGAVEERIAAGARTVRRTFASLIDDEAVRALMLCDPSYLEAAFSAIVERRGDVRTYLREDLAVTPTRAARIAAKLVV